MLPKYNLKFKWKNLSQKLIAENCLTFGQHSRLTSKRITKYLLGTRGSIEIFKLYELRYLLLRIYPLIHTLFQNSRAKLQLAFGKVKKAESKKRPLFAMKDKFLKKQPLFHVKQKNLPIQVLFASTTPALATLISEAAQICNMPSHQNRWLSGSITGALAYLFDNKFWSSPLNDTQEEVSYFFRKHWSQNKENWAKSKERARYFNRSRWPSLIVIPDISNNSMILAEIKKIGLPVIGLVNSDCRFEIEYPIFAQDQSFSSIHFFCHFLATLIAKELVYWQHKAYIKKRLMVKKKLPLVSLRLKKSFQQLVMQRKFKAYHKNPYFLKSLLPTLKKIGRRTSLSQKAFAHPYRFFLNEDYAKKNEKQRKKIDKKNYYFLRKQAQKQAHEWIRLFKMMLAYGKRARLDSSLLSLFKEFVTRFQNVWHFRKQMLKKADFPVWNLLKKEEQNKYLSNGKPYLPFFVHSAHRSAIFTQLFANFLWVPKKTHLFWKYKRFSPRKRIFLPTSYYWWTIQHFANDLKWKGHKHIVRKIVHILGSKKRFRNRFGKRWQKQKNYKNNYKQNQKKTNAPAGASKKPWNNWVTRSKKPDSKGQKNTSYRTARDLKRNANN